MVFETNNKDVELTSVFVYIYLQVLHIVLNGHFLIFFFKRDDSLSVREISSYYRQHTRNKSIYITFKLDCFKDTPDLVRYSLKPN